MSWNINREATKASSTSLSKMPYDAVVWGTTMLWEGSDEPIAEPKVTKTSRANVRPLGLRMAHGVLGALLGMGR